MPDFLDRLGDELLRAAQAPLTAPSSAPRAHVRARRLRGPAPMRRRWLLAMLALLLAGAAAAAIATSGRRSPGPVPPRPGATLALEPEPLQRAAFSILRRDQNAGDQIPSQLPVALSGASGANLGLSRHTRGPGEGEAWVVPGRGSVCLISSWPLARGGGAACAGDSSALAGRLVVASGSAQAPGVDFLAGLLPDGVERVTVKLRGGHTVTVAVHENVYLAAIEGNASAVTFVGPHGPVTLEGVAIPGR